MVWLEGGQGEVRGACAPPPPPKHPKLPHLDPRPHHHPELPHLNPPPPQPTLPEPPSPS